MVLATESEYFHKHVYIPLLLNQLSCLQSRVDKIKKALIQDSHERQLNFAKTPAMNGFPSYRMLLKWANIEYRSRHYLEAAFFYDIASKASPVADTTSAARIHRMLAKCHINMNRAPNSHDVSIHFADPVEAMKHLKISASLDPADCRYIFYMAKVAFAMEKLPEAVFYLKRFLQSITHDTEWCERARWRTSRMLLKIQCLMQDANKTQSPHRFPQDVKESLSGINWLHASLRPESIPLKGSGIVSSDLIPAGSHVFISPDAYVMFETPSDTNWHAGADVTLNFMARFLYGLLQTLLRNPSKMQGSLLLDSTSHWGEIEEQRIPMTLSPQEKEYIGPEHTKFVREQLDLTSGIKDAKLPTEYVSLYVRLYRIVSTNAHGIPPAGSALFPLASRINHSCCASISNPVSPFSRASPGANGWPSMNPSVGGGVKMVGHSTCAIQAGEEITIQYVTMSMAWCVKIRRQMLEETWKFVCQCPMCQLQVKLRESSTFSSTFEKLEKLAQEGQMLIANCKIVLEWTPNAETRQVWLNLEANLAQKLQCLGLNDFRDKDADSILDLATHVKDYQHMQVLLKDCPPTSVRCVVYMTQAALVDSLQLLASDIAAETGRARAKQNCVATLKSLKRELRIHSLSFLTAWADADTDIPVNCDRLPHAETIGVSIEALAASSSQIRRCLLEINISSDVLIYDDKILGIWQEKERYYADIMNAGDDIIMSGIDNE